MFKRLWHRFWYGKEDAAAYEVLPPRNAFERTMQLIGANLWRLCKLNAIALPFALPLVLWCWANVRALLAEGVDSLAVLGYFFIGLPVCAAIWGLGQAGMLLSAQEMVEDVDSPVLGSFITSLKKYAGLGLTHGALSGAAISLLGYGACVYALLAQEGAGFSVLLAVVLVMLAFVLLVEQFVLPQAAQNGARFKKAVVSAGKLTIRHFAYAFLLLLIKAAPLVFGLLMPLTLLYFVIVGFSLGALLNALMGCGRSERGA